MDGTFGACDSKLLLFIVLAIDEAYRGECSFVLHRSTVMQRLCAGVPVGFLLVSAPSDNTKTCAG
jgi:hypothetical protein